MPKIRLYKRRLLFSPSGFMAAHVVPADTLWLIIIFWTIQTECRVNYELCPSVLQNKSRHLTTLIKESVCQLLFLLFFFNGCQCSFANNNETKPKYLGFRPTAHLSGPGPESQSRAVDLWIFLSVSGKVIVNALENIQIGYYCYVSVHTGMCDNALLPPVCLVCWPLMCWCGRPGDRPGTDASGHRECKNLEKHPRKTAEAAIPKGNEKSQFVCLSVLLDQMARNASRCPVPQEAHDLDKS